MGEELVWRSFQRSVEIQLTNKTQDVTLHNPRSYCFSGYCSTPPSPRIPTGLTESCLFTNSSMSFRGCVGLLVYEADTFTLAILFSNPFNYGLYSMELAVEISLNKAHLGNLKDVYKEMYNRQHPPPTGGETTYHHVLLGSCQEAVTVSAGRVKVTATMSNATKSIVKIVMENGEGAAF